MRASRRSLLIVTAALAVLLGMAGTWTVATGNETAAPPRPEFWSNIGALGHYSEYDPPANLVEAAEASDAIVVAHVTGVTRGRQNRGYNEAPDAARFPLTTYVQLKVDRVVRVVKGSVEVGDTINLDMPPVMDLAWVRNGQPSGKQLFFLVNRAWRVELDGYKSQIVPSDYITWSPVSYRAVLSQGPHGLTAPLDMDDQSAFVATFNASTVDEAADRAAQAGR